MCVHACLFVYQKQIDASVFEAGHAGNGCAHETRTRNTHLLVLGETCRLLPPCTTCGEIYR